MKVVTFKTKRGTPIEPYMPHSEMPVERGHADGRRYRLCQILPPVPQRFEWINTQNIVKVAS